MNDEIEITLAMVEQLRPEVPKQFLDFWQRESFFDAGVQAVLKERGPSEIERLLRECDLIVLDQSTRPDALGYPIAAWSVCDSYCLVRDDANALCFNQLFFVSPVWLAALLNAVVQSRVRKLASRHDPSTALDWLMRWREDRYLRETNHVEPIPGPAKWNDVVAEIQKSHKHTFTVEAFKTAVCKENRRRREIWNEWAPCWQAHFQSLQSGQDFIVGYVWWAKYFAQSLCEPTPVEAAKPDHPWPLPET